MHFHTTKNLNIARQSGISLLIALVFLAGIMLIGMLTYTVSDTQYKQSGNQQFQAAALDSAEAAISIAETWLVSGGKTGNRLNSAFDIGGTSSQGLYAPGTAFDPMVEANWTNSVAIATNPPQQYIIQKTNAGKPFSNPLNDQRTVSTTYNKYRIVARGTSAKGALRIVETSYVLEAD
jgi:Tfp pilus assembly protein PilX